ncbi:MAG: carbon-nitrogen hydrolase family protein [Polyangiales bacterium]
MRLRVAACAYPVEAPLDFAAYADKQARWVEAAAEQGAQLLVFPEYASVELTSALAADVRGDLARELVALQPWLPGLLETFSALAAKHHLHILGPSFPELAPTDGRFYNRARLHTPDGRVGVAEKVQMTRFEAEEWGISAGAEAAVFDTALGTLGVAICYDSEFPLLVRAQVAQGAQLILVPSNTDTFAGYHRVALSCRARALENQCYVLQAPTVGEAPGSLALDHNHGAAAVYGPVDRGFTDDGVIARGALDVPGWVMADLDLDALAHVREHGQVRNSRDWDNAGHVAARSTRASLR